MAARTRPSDRSVWHGRLVGLFKIAIMHKYVILLLMCSSSIMAQNLNTDFQAFRRGVLENYSGFRKTVLDNYTVYLQGVWDEYELFRGIKRDKIPKPNTVPQAEPNSTDVPHILPAPEPEPDKVPSTLPTDAPRPFAPVPPMAPNVASTIEFMFYGIMVKAASCKVRNIDDIGHEDIAKVWKAYRNDGAMKGVVGSLQSLAEKYGLNDWFVFELVRKYTGAVCGNEGGRILLQHFLLANMGYDIRLASSDVQLVLLVCFKQQVYERNYLVIDGKRYYVFFDTNALSNRCRGLYTCRLPGDADNGHSVDLTFHHGNFGIKTGKEHAFNLSDGRIRLNGVVDSGMMEAIRHYPQMDVPFYAMSDICSNVHASILAQMKSQIYGCSQKEAVSRVLHFVQYAFAYATDGEQHGYEKPYFIEENFYYLKNDCEDRAVLFAFFVRNLLGLDVHLVQYPGHECTAVHFTVSDINGDGYSYNGKTFYVCDPTYIGASIGQCMPEYKNVKPKVEQWY